MPATTITASFTIPESVPADKVSMFIDLFMRSIGGPYLPGTTNAEQRAAADRAFRTWVFGKVRSQHRTEQGRAAQEAAISEIDAIEDPDGGP